jgi:hypothetical protein
MQTVEHRYYTMHAGMAWFCEDEHGEEAAKKVSPQETQG